MARGSLGEMTGNLVVVQVGVDEERGGELILDLHDARGVHPLALQPLAIVAKIRAGRGHDAWPFAQQGQVVGDVAGAASPLLAHGIHQETEADGLDLLWQNVVREVAWKRHQVVVGQGTGDNDGQG